MRHLLLALLLAASLPLARAASHEKGPVIEVPSPDNRADQLQKHYVVLVSIDGFRYDYAKLYGAPHLTEIAKAGATAPDGMLPSYPSTTFPNHYSIVTGLYPEHHGIVAMSFYDPVRKERYAFNDPKTVTDGSWYGGVPLWSLAEKQGMRAACFFWPGSEAEIAGKRPSYYLKYDDALPDEERVDQVVEWLKLPEAKRPHFITLYFGEVDHAGHKYAPDAPETRAAVKHVDGDIGVLRSKLAKLRLPIDLIVVSDHGMAKEEGGWIDLDQYADFTRMETAATLMYPLSDAEAAKLYTKLRIQSDKFKVYRRNRVPAELNYSSNPRIGDPVVVPTGPYAIRIHAPSNPAQDPPNKGAHGYDPHTMPEMKAIFYAEGPDIRAGVRLKPFENVNLYPFMAEILGLDAPATDGNASLLDPALVSH
jgi:predicted AlkP superfamily pyrophosphatase or phosphodiesterase